MCAMHMYLKSSFAKTDNSLFINSQKSCLLLELPVFANMYIVEEHMRLSCCKFGFPLHVSLCVVTEHVIVIVFIKKDTTHVIVFILSMY